MTRGRLALLAMLAAFAGCPGGGSSIGEPCDGNGDCGDGLQCRALAAGERSYCVARCERAPECGDGYTCSEQGLCQRATKQAGDNCESEVDCEPGLSCRIDGATVNLKNRLIASCAAETSARASGAACSEDDECRNGTCALGRCVDLCRTSRDCSADASCVDIPRVAADGSMFAGCLPSQGTLSWSIPMSGPSAEVLLPVPAVARSAALVMSVDDASQKVGAASVLSPAGARVYTLPCSPPVTKTDPACSPEQAFDQYYANKLRHLPELQQSVLLIPSAPSTPLEAGAYRVRVSSFDASGAPGIAVPRLTAVVRIGAGATLDLHFFFLDLDDHPCVTTENNTRLDASTAPTATMFQDYVTRLSAMLKTAGLTPGRMTYNDVKDHPELDGLNVADVGKLLALGTFATGINVFFVRSLSPIGIQATGPNPGPAGLAGTPQSGVVLGLDTLCYRNWPELARLTMHELARYMGLYHNVELETTQHQSWRDPIHDSDDSPDNLMYFSETDGTDLSPGQRALLGQSGVLQ